MNSLRRTRRSFLKFSAIAGTLTAFAAAGLLKATQAAAAAWNKSGFESKAAADAVKSLGASGAAESRDIVITAPDIAENGAVVPIEVVSRIPNTQSISIIAEKNPFPLAATLDFANGAEPYAYVRIKMGQTSNVRAVVNAGGKFFTAAKEVKITIGGCG
ncbi:MAG TPA: thiosulfate oxidation carrier protein SoxY [Burkholderiales bacterium]|nr:thiosulfate oxidation carrier protein SoxY [Burkholderiales bacterium]